MRTEEPRRVAVVGPGGVGGLLAALLARAGHGVVCLAGERTTGVLRERGLRVSSTAYGEFTAHVEARTELHEPVDVCFLGVKHTALAASLARIPREALGEALLVPLLNGLEHPGLLRAHHDERHVAPGAIRVESTRVEPGVIAHTSPFAEVALAGDGVPPELLQGTARLLEGAGVPTSLGGNEAAVLWQKMYFLAPAALLTTRYRTTLGEVRTRHRAELGAVVAEAVSAGRADGAPGDAETVLAQYDTFPAPTKSSMLRDAEAGRALELDAIGGALLRAAARVGVPAPTAERLVAEVAEREGAPVSN